MDTLRSARQPVAWVVIGAAAAKGLLSLIMMLTSLDRGVARAAQTWSGSVITVVSAALILAVVLSLVLVAPRPPQTRALLIAAVSVVGGLGVIALIGAFVGLADIGGGGSSLVVWFLRQLLDLAVVAAIAFVLLRVMMSVGAQDGAGSGHQGGSTQIAEPTGYPTRSLPPQPMTGSQPMAQHAPAPESGAVWGSASQAATGSQVSGWGVGGPQSGHHGGQPGGHQGGWSSPQSLPPQGTGTPQSLPPQPTPPGAPPHSGPGTGQQRPNGPGPGDGGPPQDYTRIAPPRHS